MQKQLSISNQKTKDVSLFSNDHPYKKQLSNLSVSSNLSQLNQNHVKKLSLIGESDNNFTLKYQRKERENNTSEKAPLEMMLEKADCNTTFIEEFLEREGKQILSTLIESIQTTPSGEVRIDAKKLLKESSVTSYQHFKSSLECVNVNSILLNTTKATESKISNLTHIMALSPPGKTENNNLFRQMNKKKITLDITRKPMMNMALDTQPSPEVKFTHKKNSTVISEKGSQLSNKSHHQISTNNNNTKARHRSNNISLIPTPVANEIKNFFEHKMNKPHPVKMIQCLDLNNNTGNKPKVVISRKTTNIRPLNKTKTALKIVPNNNNTKKTKGKVTNMFNYQKKLTNRSEDIFSYASEYYNSDRGIDKFIFSRLNTNSTNRGFIEEYL